MKTRGESTWRQGQKGTMIFDNSVNLSRYEQKPEIEVLVRRAFRSSSSLKGNEAKDMGCAAERMGKGKLCGESGRWVVVLGDLRTEGHIKVVHQGDCQRRNKNVMHVTCPMNKEEREKYVKQTSSGGPRILATLIKL